MTTITITLITISISLYIVSGLSKSICDVSSSSEFSKSKLSLLNKPLFWCKSLSSANKYKNGDKAQGEKFLGSTTVFVWLTDAWHLFDFIRDLSLVIAVFVFPNVYIVIVGYFIKQVVFELSYRWLKTK